MAKFQFDIDTEQKIWHRHTVKIDAVSFGDALSRVIDMAECWDIPENAIYQRLDDTATDTGNVVILDNETGTEVYKNY